MNARKLVLQKMKREAWTQERLAAKLGLRQGAVSKHLSGKLKPDAEARNKYAKWVGVEPLEWN